MKVLDKAVRLDFFTAAPPKDAATVSEEVETIETREFLLTEKQRAPSPYPYQTAVLRAVEVEILSKPLEGAALSVGPFLPRDKWEGDADEDKYTHLLFALTNAKDGREADFDHWYWKQHFPDGLRLPGCFAGRRYLLSKDGDGQFRHLAIYQFNIDDIGDTIDALAKRAGTPEMPITDAISNVYSAWFVKPKGGWV